MSIKTNYLIYSVIPAALFVVLAFILVESPATLAQDDSAYVRKVRVIDGGELGLANLAGLAYSNRAEVLLTMATPKSDELGTAGSQIAMIALHEELAGTVPLASSISDPTTVAYDDKNDGLYLVASASTRLIEIELAGTDGLRVVADMALPEIGAEAAQGMSFDPKSGRLFILDESGSGFLMIERERPGTLDGPAPLRDGTTSWIELSDSEPKTVNAMAYNPADGHLYLQSQGENRLYEVTVSGQVLTTRDLSSFGLVDPQGMVFAPSGDPTDEAQEMSLYVVDRGAGSSGGIVELSLTEPVVQSAYEYHTVQADLVDTTHTSQFVPPSPDPAGIAYLSTINRLLISDSEVDEMPIYAGANLFETTLSGSLVYTASTMDFPDEPTDEPTGAAFNPHNGHLFISDDDADNVFELDPGFDGDYGTSDDNVTSFSTRNFGSQDPEGIAFDTVSGYLYVVDGVGKEVYEVRPGANGEFDGASPEGDDQVSNFDVGIYGILDPEGIESTGIVGSAYIGTLYILDRGTDVVIETTTTGEIVRMIDLSAISPFRGAGLAYAPGSVNPAGMNLYIVDRGVDNNQNSDENDGELYEMSLPITPDNLRPTVNAGSDQAITVGDSAALDGSAGDDGLPDPPDSLMTLWKKVSGPGAVAFGNERARDTTATFSTAGIYVLRLTADDTELIGLDEITVVVNGAPSVDAGQDQMVAYPISAMLSGTATDEGLPNPPGQLTTVWSKVTGPGNVAFADASSANTTASFSEAGVYVIRLTADDGDLVSSDEQRVTVNRVPSVDAGLDKEIKLPESAVLNGTVTDDGLPNPPGDVSTTWGKVSGPGIVTFADVNAPGTTATFSMPGVYVLRLTADDGAVQISDDSVVAVDIIKVFLPVVSKH